VVEGDIKACLNPRATSRTARTGRRSLPTSSSGSWHELWNIEKSFRMSKSDLEARPVYHRKRGSIEAHLTIVFAALAVSRWIEARTGWSIRKFVKTTRRYPSPIHPRRPAPCPQRYQPQPAGCALI
jgi:hypothetical protein